MGMSSLFGVPAAGMCVTAARFSFGEALDT